MENGEVHNGEAHNGEFHNGEVHNGEVHNGEFHNGDCHNDEVQKGEQGPLLRSRFNKSNNFPHEHEDDLPLPDNIPGKCAEQTEEFVKKNMAGGWNITQYQALPDWLKDNEYLLRGYRVPTNSFAACFKSIFRIHTETGNIWTHLLGMIVFVWMAACFLSRPSIDVKWQEKAVFSAFFMGAVLCLGFSWTFHTCSCHSEKVGKLFHKLDYSGICLMIMGSYVPVLYYMFYCKLELKLMYWSLILFLGTLGIVVSMWDKFATPKFRPLRAGTFIALGLSGVIPIAHYVILDGFFNAINHGAVGWFVLMAFLYISGAVLYALRIPERISPGKFDIWFQSHQIFHVCVFAAACIHYHGISKIANYRLTMCDCIAAEVQL